MKLRTALIATGTLTLTLTGCSELQQIRDAANDVTDSPVFQRVAGLSVAGVSPAHDFRTTGNIDLDVLPEEEETGLVTFANLQKSGMKVEVENDDGTYSECEHVGEETVEPMEYHAMTLLIDGSGSMELSYPPNEYGDVCVTCPHDPDRDRIDAADQLISTIHDSSPRSRMALAEFGPAPTPGFSVTRLHSDFTQDAKLLSGSLGDVQGYDRVGTPLYDSIAEMIGGTREQAKDFEATLRRERGEDVPWEEMTPEGEEPIDDVPEAERECARSIIVLSDGEDNESERHDVESVIDLALEAGVKVYAVGLGPASASSANPDVVDPEQTQAVRNLQKLARDTGGFYAAAKNPAQLRDLYDTVGRALTEGYQTETYSCVPKPDQETPRDEVGIPPVGSRIDGRVGIGETTIPWVTVAN